ncbi:MAG TPA: ATP-binding protein [Verrucomicrobiae bacterium]|nr:ATP-binding protein [Verrucomicrobiae bacterium]
MMQNAVRGSAAQLPSRNGFENSSQAREIESLREELREAKETLEAIRTGAADALVVSRNGKEVIYTLENADKPFRIFLEEMQEGAVTVDETGLVVYANRRFADFIVAPLESVMGSSFHEHVCTADQARVNSFLRNESGHGEKIEVSLRVGHQLVPVFLTASPFHIDDGRGGKFLCIVVTDLTPQRQVEATAAIDREWKNRYEAVVRASGHLLYDWNPHTNEVIFGGDVERILGYALSEMTGGLRQWEKLVHPDDLPAFRAECERVVASKRPFKLEYRVLHRDGGELVFQDNGYPLIHPAGHITSIVGLRMDITSRKHDEEKIRQMNSELEQRVFERTAELQFANKEMEAFCYSISHDLRAPLRSIRGYSDIVLQEYADKLDSCGQEYLRKACDSAMRMNQLLDDLLRLSVISRGELQCEQTDLGELAGQIVSGFKSSEPDRAVKFTIGRGLMASGDSRLLQIALANLLNNAWKFTSRKADGIIEFGSEDQGGERVYFVRDNGEGFEMEWKHRLFGVFERLHSAKDFPGTGIGLAIVQRIILRHGGRIWAEGKRHEGATFYFTLNDRK